MKHEADLFKLKASACENLSILDPSSPLKFKLFNIYYIIPSTEVLWHSELEED